MHRRREKMSKWFFLSFYISFVVVKRVPTHHFPIECVCYPMMVCILCKLVSIVLAIRRQKMKRQKKIDWKTHTSTTKGAKLIFSQRERENSTMSMFHFNISLFETITCRNNLEAKRQLLAWFCFSFAFWVYIYLNVMLRWNVCHMEYSMLFSIIVFKKNQGTKWHTVK